MADIISTLPDKILCHILCFLQTKQSVATSILSKRWKHLWPSVTTLRFDTNLHFQFQCLGFNDFIYSVLLSRDATLPIKTFHLNVSYGYEIRCPFISIYKWVKFVVKQRVEYLYLHFDARTRPKLPVSIITCKTLVVLKLFHFHVEEGYSSAVLLPSLKTLHLKNMWFPKPRDFIMFLSGCPILEELYTFRVSFSSDESLTCIEWKSFCLSNLTRAEIYCSYFCSYFPLKAVDNVTSLCFETDQVPYRDLVPFHNLIQLDLISLRYSCQFLVEFLNHCPNLQKLDIHQTAETLHLKKCREKWVDPDVVPQCLSLHLTTCNLFNFLGLKDELELAKYILKKAKVLQTMRIWNYGHCKKEKIVSSFPRASSSCKVTVYHDH